MPLDHFALIAPFYDRIFGVMSSNRLRELLKLPVKGWLLDAGGGTGRASADLRDQVGSLAVVDISRGMLAQARRKAGLGGARARVQRLSFADDTFERIMVVDSWHHFEDQAGAARELVRVLKPGGRLVIEDFNIDRFPVKLLALSEVLLFMGSRFPNPARIKDAFASLPAEVTIHADHPANMWAVVDKPRQP